MEEIIDVKNKNLISAEDLEKDIFRNEAVLTYKNIDVKSITDCNCKIDETENIIGIIDFNKGTTSRKDRVKNQSIPYLNVHMPPFESESCVEIWTSTNKVSYGKVGLIEFAVDGENMFASATVPIREGVPLAKLGEEVYDELFKLAVNLHYPYFYRMWNFVPDINGGDINDLERYKSFCYGRATSFFNNSLISENIQFPAATGIGSKSGDICIYFLTSSLPRYKHFENPRQVPAYNYPEQYGPKPPSFARATYYNRGRDNYHIYVSGTASVVGHESVHIGDIENQCKTTFENIEILLSKENMSKYGINKDVSLSELEELKVYIRHAEDYKTIKNLCEQQFNPQNVISYLHADVCRADLLVEIEGVIKK